MSQGFASKVFRDLLVKQSASILDLLNKNELETYERVGKIVRRDSNFCLILCTLYEKGELTSKDLPPQLQAKIGIYLEKLKKTDIIVTGGHELDERSVMLRADVANLFKKIEDSTSFGLVEYLKNLAA